MVVAYEFPLERSLGQECKGVRLGHRIAMSYQTSQAQLPSCSKQPPDVPAVSQGVMPSFDPLPSW